MSQTEEPSLRLLSHHQKTLELLKIVKIQSNKIMAQKVYQLILTIEIMVSQEEGLHLIPKTMVKMLGTQYISSYACVSLEICKRYCHVQPINSYLYL